MALLSARTGTPWVAVLALSLPGCFLSHGFEEPASRWDAGGGRADAGRRFDAGRADTGPPGLPDSGALDGDYWTLERRPALIRVQHSLGCTQYADGRVALAISTGINTSCEHAGPVETTVDADGTVVVTAYLWVQHSSDLDVCLPTTDISERTLLLPAREGTFVAVSYEGGSRAELRVGAIDDVPCSFAGAMDAPCRFDCECRDGLVCIPELGDFVACEGGRCGDPCEPTGEPDAFIARHLECDPSEQCRLGPAASAPRCQPIEGDGCDPSVACGPGLFCPPTGTATECVWDLELTGMNRHPCVGNRECEPGLRCVEHATGERRCEVPCFTNETRCPRMHHCSAERWVCEWDGE